jgi:hypothetical protein
MQIMVVIGCSLRLDGSIVIHLIKVEGTLIEKSKKRARPRTPKSAAGLVGPSSAWWFGGFTRATAFSMKLRDDPRR